jgi:hypothetical protein
MLERLSARVVAAIVAGALLLLIVLAGPAACEKIRSLKAQSKVSSAQAGAAANSGADAVNTVQSVGSNQAESEELGRNNERDIRKATGADQKVGADVNAAGRAALCKRAAYRNEPMCKVKP